ncbi:hypothetical protein ACFV3R_26595 [Streptomyces sp. NPDC059740]|uniref:hypothetical protein n=1 Tax=Streptomyces sp. NPDC059740 TaxID=3346926 RepID=UPI003646ECC5
MWALREYDFKAVISSRFADIFRGNSLKRGLLTVILPQGQVEKIWALTEADPQAAVTVDLVAREVRAGEETFPFDCDDEAYRRLLGGPDDISLTLKHIEESEEYEKGRPDFPSDPPRTGLRTVGGGGPAALPRPTPTPRG